MKLFTIILLFLAVNLAAGVAILPPEELKKRSCQRRFCSVQPGKRDILPPPEELQKRRNSQSGKRDVLPPPEQKRSCQRRFCSVQPGKRRSLRESLKRRLA
jgi:hypothetical protein